MSHPILILGANGRVGRKLVEYAAQSGFQVTALVRDASRFEPGHLVKQVVEGDATDPAVLDRILPGQRAVLAAIGTRDIDQDVTVMTDMARNLIPAMKAHGVWRLVAVAGAGILQDAPDHLRMEHPSFPRMFRKVSEDHYRTWQLLQASDLKWTLACPPFVPDGPFTGQYETRGDYPPHAARQIYASDLADWMVKEMMNEQYLRARVGISNSASAPAAYSTY